MYYHKNARTTVWSREADGASECSSRDARCPRCSRRQRERQDCRQVGTALSLIGAIRAQRIAPAGRIGCICPPRLSRWSWLRFCDDSVAPGCASPSRQASVEPLSAASCARTSSAACAIWSRRARQPLRTPQPRRPVSPRHQEAGRIAKPGHRVTGNPAHRSRRVGWEYVHVAIDDHSLIAYSAIFADETADLYRCHLPQLRPLLTTRGSASASVRILTDNGPAYRSRSFALVCARLGLKHRFTTALHPAHQWKG